MVEVTAVPVKKTTRTRKTVKSSIASDSSSSLPPKFLGALEELFGELINRINEAKTEFISLQNQIEEVRMSWVREQKDRELETAQRNQQEDIVRRREQEEYEYEKKRTRKQEEDAFLEKKEKWEKELSNRKEEIEKDKKELEMLRKQVEGFDTEIEKAVKEVRAQLSKELTEQFGNERKLREQEVKAGKELLELKITNLASENSRNIEEIKMLKQSLEEATRQIKDVAVKVIESANPAKTSFTE